MKTLLKTFVIALCCVLCCSPFSLFAEESSSFIIASDFNLSSSQVSFLNSLNDASSYYIFSGSNTDYTIGVLDPNGTFNFSYDSIFTYTGTLTEVYVDGRIVQSVVSNRTYNLNSSNLYWLSFPRGDINICSSVSNSDSLNVCKVFTITVSANPSNGGVVSGGGNYPYGDYFTVSAIPNDGYVLDYWEYIFNGVSNTWEPWPSWTNKCEGDEQYIAHFKYTGLTPPSPTPTPTPTPEPDVPLYEMNTDFKYLLSNPAIASLVQYAVNDLASNTWWIERELYYYETASCPSGSTPLYSEFGYVERFVLYNYTSDGLEQISDSINHQGQSSLGCLISSSESTVVIPRLESSPTITETLFFGFDLFEIPEADFYQLLVQIKNTLSDSSVSNSINNVNNSIISGNGISQNVTSSLVDENSSLNSSIDSYDTFESQFNDNLTSSLSNINLDSVQLGNSSDFVKTASWVKVQFDHILDSSGLYKTAISFVLIVGLALLLIGRRL